MHNSEGVHIFLDFDNAPTPDLKINWESKLAALSQQQIAPGRYLDWDVVNELGQSSNLREFLHREVSYDTSDSEETFNCTAWETLVCLNEPIYQELVLEFFSTYNFNRSAPNSTDPHGVAFRLGGTEYMMSRLELVERLGLFTPAQLGLYNGRALPNYLNNCDRDPPSSFNYKAFWTQIGNGNFSAGYSRESNMRNEHHRLIHRLVACTVCVRKGGQEKVSKQDLWVMHHLLNKERHIDLSWLVALALRDAAGTRQSSPIHLGHLVTRLAKSFNLLAPYVISSMHVCPPMGEIGVETLRRMSVIRPTPSGSGFVWGDPSYLEGPIAPSEEEDDDGSQEQDQPPPPRPSISIHERFNRLDLAAHHLQYEARETRHFNEWQHQTLTELCQRQQPPYQPPPYEPYPSLDPQAPYPPGYGDWGDWFRDHP